MVGRSRVAATTTAGSIEAAPTRGGVTTTITGVTWPITVAVATTTGPRATGDMAAAERGTEATAVGAASIEAGTIDRPDTVGITEGAAASTATVALTGMTVVTGMVGTEVDLLIA